nr:hypothetical protein CFP56_31804 [Quercus suber]
MLPIGSPLPRSYKLNITSSFVFDILNAICCRCRGRQPTPSVDLINEAWTLKSKSLHLIACACMGTSIEGHDQSSPNVLQTCLSVEHPSCKFIQGLHVYRSRDSCQIVQISLRRRRQGNCKVALARTNIQPPGQHTPDSPQAQHTMTPGYQHGMPLVSCNVDQVNDDDKQDWSTLEQ